MTKTLVKRTIHKHRKNNRLKHNPGEVVRSQP